MATITLEQLTDGKTKITVKNGTIKIDSKVRVTDMVLSSNGMSFKLKTEKIEIEFPTYVYSSSIKVHDLYCNRHVLSLYGDWDIVTG